MHQINHTIVQWGCHQSNASLKTKWTRQCATVADGHMSRIWLHMHIFAVDITLSGYKDWMLDLIGQKFDGSICMHSVYKIVIIYLSCPQKSAP